jgi:tryptophan synthase alpha chain
MNRLKSRLAQRGGHILNVYFTAGYPQLDSLPRVLRALDQAGVDLIELGIPFSDPLADGPTIQAANQTALDNGMHLRLLLAQLREVRAEIQAPIILMGYLNSVLQYGVSAFLADAQAAGVDGLILPDLPVEVYARDYQAEFEAHGLGLCFLVTPRSSEERIRRLDALSQGFLYVVSSAAITGGSTGISPAQVAYFQRLADMGLSKPRLIGFGISDGQDFAQACAHADGAIIGSAFIRHLAQHGDDPAAIGRFIQSIRNPQTTPAP